MASYRISWLGLSRLLVMALLDISSIGYAHAQAGSAMMAREPVSLPDMALGSKSAPVTIVEYSSMTCSHCANFEQNVFAQLKARYIDTGKVRFIFREFPIDVVAAGGSMVARCSANGDPNRYFHALDLIFQQQPQLISNPKPTLLQVGRQVGMTDQQTQACLSDQSLLDHLNADKDIAYNTLKIGAAPTFFINDQMHQGTMSFETLDRIIAPMLR